MVNWKGKGKKMYQIIEVSAVRESDREKRLQ